MWQLVVFLMYCRLYLSLAFAKGTTAVMKKVAIAIAFCFVLHVAGGVCHGQLVFPLIDNIRSVTIIKISNTGLTPVVLDADLVSRDSTGAERRDNFSIRLTPKETFVWLTNKPYAAPWSANHIQGYENRQGFLIVAGPDSLIGSATLISKTDGTAFSYQPGASDWFSGLAGIPGALNGTLTLASLQDVEFSINLYCRNEYEMPFSRHLRHRGFRQYDLITDLELDVANTITLGFWCMISSAEPFWAVFHEGLAAVFGWGSAGF
jgi:hypothetical protein